MKSEHSEWLTIDQDFPYGIYSPSISVKDHQTKWRYLVTELNLAYGEDWMLRIPENRQTYDVWCFKDEKNALAFCLKWS